MAIATRDPARCPTATTARAPMASGSLMVWHRNAICIAYIVAFARSYQGRVPREVRRNLFFKLLQSEEPVVRVQLPFDNPFAVWQPFDRKPAAPLRMQQIRGTIPDPSAGAPLRVQVTIAVVVRRPVREGGSCRRCGETLPCLPTPALYCCP
jgi:hypothetical protein